MLPIESFISEMKDISRELYKEASPRKKREPLEPNLSVFEQNAKKIMGGLAAGGAVAGLAYARRKQLGTLLKNIKSKIPNRSEKGWKHLGTSGASSSAPLRAIAKGRGKKLMLRETNPKRYGPRTEVLVKPGRKEPWKELTDWVETLHFPEQFPYRRTIKPPTNLKKTKTGG